MSIVTIFLKKGIIALKYDMIMKAETTLNFKIY